MNLLRNLYIRSTNLTHGYQDKESRMVSLYRLWAPFYDLSIKLDPAYHRNLNDMIRSTVARGDHTLDIGCGTGLATIICSEISKQVIGVDSSAEMLGKLKKKIRKHGIANIELREGFFPQAMNKTEKFDSIVSSFMLVHLSQESRTQVVQAMYGFLKPGAKIGLFSARGEIAPAFQTRREIEKNLSSAGFKGIDIKDVDDIYRISCASK